MGECHKSDYAKGLTIKAWRAKASTFLLSKLSARLAEYAFKDAGLDADILLEKALQKPRAFILSHLDTTLPQATLQTLETHLARRATGLAMAYIIGEKEFFGLPFFVDENVLIPKPDTETLVEIALAHLATHPKTHLRLLDTCCGTGCIGISIVKKLIPSIIKRKFLFWEGGLWKEPTNCFGYVSSSDKLIELTLQDISPKALAIAKHNAHKLLRSELNRGLVGLRFELADATGPVKMGETFDCITANPPYVPREIVKELLRDGRGEPSLALDGGAEGLSLYASLAKNFYASLKPNSWAFIEAGEYNIEKARELFLARGFTSVTIHPDLTGAPRVISAIK